MPWFPNTVRPVERSLSSCLTLRSFTLAPGCKRIILDPGYLESLHRPNVELNWNAIDRVVEDGLKLKTGEVVPVDIIVFATGFYLYDPRVLSHGTC